MLAYHALLKKLLLTEKGNLKIWRISASFDSREYAVREGWLIEFRSGF